jgi:hypothetical protein
VTELGNLAIYLFSFFTHSANHELPTFIKPRPYMCFSFSRADLNNGRTKCAHRIHMIVYRMVMAATFFVP